MNNTHRLAKSPGVVVQFVSGLLKGRHTFIKLINHVQVRLQTFICQQSLLSVTY